MKDYITTGRKISKITRSKINQIGYPNNIHQVDLHIEIIEPYVIGYSLYVSYSFNRWQIDYSYRPLTVRADMEHIYSIKTEKDMLNEVEKIVKQIRIICGVI